MNLSSVPATAAPATGSTAQLLAWPSPDFLATQKPGDVVPNKVITPTTDLNTLGSIYRNKADGTVRVEEDTFGQTAKDFTSKDLTTRASSLQAAGFSLPATADAPACRPGYGCTVCNPDNVLVTTYTSRQEIFANIYAYSGAHANVDETDASTHDLGIGTAVTGGDWGESASVDLDTEIKAGADTNHIAHVQMSNTVDYGHYERHCNGQQSFYEHTVSPLKFHTLEDQDLETLINSNTYLPSSYGDCQYASYGTFTKEQGSGIHFSEGVSAPFINLESQASYSTSTKTAYAVTQKSDICGDGDEGWGNDPNFGAQPDTGCQSTNGTMIVGTKVVRRRSYAPNAPSC